MSGQRAFHVQSVIVGVLQPGVFRVALSNGHQLVAYGLRRDRNRLADLGIGDQVELELLPYDLSKGRIRMHKTEQS